MPDKATKNKHLTRQDRELIMSALATGCSFKHIAKLLGKDPTTISKEIKKHFDIRPTSVSYTDSDGNPAPAPVCPQLIKAPYVCNPCSKLHKVCKYDKHVYIASTAQDEYETFRSESRQCLALSEEAFTAFDNALYKAVHDGQHIYHFITGTDSPYSVSSVYRLQSEGKLSISAIDLPRKVKFKERAHKPEDSVPSKAKIGRTYEDFQTYIADNDIRFWNEIDTVVGRVGGKLIFTCIFTGYNFMFGLLLEDKTAAQMSLAIKGLKKRLIKAGYDFGDIFPLLLSDNGGEFSCISTFENDLDGNKESSMYFCRPYKSSDKPRVEKNHTLFRDICPKGTSFDNFTQEKINMIFSHVNSVKRKIYNGKTPYEVFTFAFSKDLARVLGIQEIPALEVKQDPSLLDDLGIVR